MNLKDLLNPSNPMTKLRAGVDSQVAKSANKALEVVDDGGDWGVGLVRNVPICTRGPALGHAVWIDSYALGQLVAKGNTERGLKGRLAHPGMCDDAVGTVFCRTKNLRLESNKVVLGDVHLLPEGSMSPKHGDINRWFLEAARNNPDTLGMSIVFEKDEAEEKEFAEAHTSETGFVSPDKDTGNLHNLHHVRIGKVFASDMVDTPAANPGGMIAELSQENSGQKVALALDYITGALAEKPTETFFGVDLSRARAVFARYLEHSGQKILPSVTPSQRDDPEPHSKGSNPMTKEELIRALSGHGIDVVALQQTATLAGVTKLLKSEHGIDLSALQSQAQTLSEVAKLLKLDSTDKEGLFTAIANLQTEAANAVKLAAAAKQAAAVARVDKAIGEGRIQPAAKEAWTGLAIDKTDEQWDALMAGLKPAITPGQQLSRDSAKGELPNTGAGKDVIKLSDGTTVPREEYSKEKLKALVNKASKGVSVGGPMASVGASE